MHENKGLIPRSTIEEIVGYRNLALELYAEAFDAIEIADAKIKAAHEMARRASPGVTAYNYDHHDEIKRFHAAVKLPDRAEYLRTARKLTDIDVWSWVISMTELERLMDKEAKDTLRSQLRYVPDRVDPHTREIITGEEIEKGMPPVTVENIYATLERFVAEADLIFKRGIANAFSKLDRRFKSHDGFKIGSRVILTRAFNDHGGWHYHSNERDTLMDIERTFAVLDGRMITHNYASTIGAIDHLRSGVRRPRQDEVLTDYFKVRIFKNGNAHLWFTRDDLVEKVNRLLADYYGEVIGDSQTKEDPFDAVKHAPARYFGFFPTPEHTAALALSAFPLFRHSDDPPLRILEPSAGTGNLARLCAAERRHREWSGDRAEYTYQAMVDCVEIQPHLADGLKAEGIYNRVFCGDFLRLTPAVTGLYDRIVMNPPFDRERDIDHVVHALGFLKPDGCLLAIMSAGTEFRETKKAAAFRELMAQKRARWDALPACSFSEAGTNVNTVVVQFWNNGRRAR